MNGGKMKKNAIAAAIILGFCWLTPARAADIYVTADAGAPNGNGSLSSPYATIAAGLASAQAGDHVRLLPGVYYEPVSFPRAGSSGNPISLVSHGGARSAVIDCQNANVNCVTADRAHLIIDGLEVRNANYNGIKIDGDVNGTDSAGSYGNYGGYGERSFRANGADNITIENCYVHDVGFDGIKVGHANHVQLIGNEIYRAGVGNPQQGIDLVGVYDGLIKDNYVHDEASSNIDVGMFAKGGSEDITFENNRVENIASPFAAIELGGDTEWWNTRYTPADFGYDINAQILDPGQTNSSNIIDNAATYEAQHMAECRNCTALNNLIIAADPAISARNAYNAKIYHNTIIDSGWTQGWYKLWNDGNAAHPCQETRWFNNLASNRTGVTLRGGAGTSYQIKEAPSAAGFESDYSLYYFADGAATVVSGQDAHSVFLNPQLTANYELNSGSPAIDGGRDLLAAGIIGSAMTDRDGVLRPQGAGYDAGAFEYREALPPDGIPPIAPTGLTVQ